MIELEQPVRDLDPERVVAPKHIANTCDEDLHVLDRSISAARSEYPWMTHQAM